jgi:phosphoribosylformylglycinamidine cyclo-ligase
LSYAAAAPFAPSGTLADELLRPTRLYVKPCLAALKAGVKAYAHITGGGLIENVPRVLPDGLAAEIDATTWTLPPVFGWLARTAGIARPELARTFNCGIGMVAITAPDQADAVARVLVQAGERVHRIGRIVTAAGGSEAHLINMERAWPG